MIHNSLNSGVNGSFSKCGATNRKKQAASSSLVLAEKVSKLAGSAWRQSSLSKHGSVFYYLHSCQIFNPQNGLVQLIDCIKVFNMYPSVGAQSLEVLHVTDVPVLKSQLCLP